MQKYITVSQAIRKARSRVVYPALFVMFLTIAAAIFILASFEESLPLIILSIILIVSSFVAFAAIMTYFGDKWKTWAYKHVDDVRELRDRAPDNRFSVNIFPSRRHLSIRRERLKAFKVVRERIKNNTLKVTLEDDYSIPRKLEIKRSLFYYLVPLGVCIWACYKTSGRLIDGTSVEFVTDAILFLLSCVGIVFLLFKAIQHPTLVIISEEGIYSKKTGFQAWDKVNTFAITDRRIYNTNNGASNIHQLYISFGPASGLEDKRSVIKYDITYLNKNADTIERTMKVHHHRYTPKWHSFTP